MSTTVYVLRDKEHQDVGSLNSYHRTLKEAQEHQSQSRRFSREHPEPDGLPGTEYLEIVVEEIDWYPCVVCGGHVTSNNPEKYPYCRNCHYNGRAAEDESEGQLDYFRTQLPGWEIGVEHTGGGCFWMAFYPPDDRREFIIATDGEASLPAVSIDDEWQRIRGGWGAVCVQYKCEPQCYAATINGPRVECDNKCCDYEDPPLFYVPFEEDEEGRDEKLLSDEQLVALIKEWAAPPPVAA